MIFKAVIFKTVETKKLYKKTMNKLDDPSIPFFRPLSTGSFIIEENRKVYMQKEILYTYLFGAKKLNELDLKNNPSGPWIYQKFQYTKPILFLCRHSLELAIKYAIEQTGNQAENIHSLSELWDELINVLGTQVESCDKKILKSMNKFIKNIDSLDPTGTRLRYTYKKEEFLWVCASEVISNSELFISQLIECSIIKKKPTLKIRELAFHLFRLYCIFYFAFD